MALARQQLIVAEKRDGMKAQRRERQDQQSQRYRQGVRELVEGKMTIVPATCPFHFRGKVSGLQVVGDRNNGQEDNRQHGQRDQLDANGRQKRGFALGSLLAAARQAL